MSEGSPNYTRRVKPIRYDDDTLARVEAVCGTEAVMAMTSNPSPYSEVHRRVGDDVKVTTCCCKAAGAKPRECADASGNKTPCRCYCHSRRLVKTH